MRKVSASGKLFFNRTKGQDPKIRRKKGKRQNENVISSSENREGQIREIHMYFTLFLHIYIGYY